MQVRVATVVAVQSNYGPVGPDIDQKSRDEALGALSDLPDWLMPSAAWQEVERVVEALTSALSAGDQSAVTAATVRLEVMSDFRVPKVGDQKGEPPPKTVRDQAVYLIHSLGGASDRDRKAEGDRKNKEKGAK